MTYAATPPASAPEVGIPVYDASFMLAVKRFFSGYVAFRGRASRREFWFAYLFIALTQLPFTIALLAMVIALTGVSAQASVSGAAADSVTSVVGLSLSVLVVSVITSFVSLALTLPFLSVTWRRLQDAGFHGALSLLMLVFPLVPLIMCTLPTSQGAAAYGPGSVAEAQAQTMYSGYAHPGQQPHAPAPRYAPPHAHDPYNR